MPGSPVIRTLPVGPLQCNCSIVADPEEREAVVIDPGDGPDRILLELATIRCRAVAILHTHGHFDHVGATARVNRATGAAIRIHEADQPLYDALVEQASFFGLKAESPAPPDGGLADGETIAFGRFGLAVISTPGHTPGSTCFLLPGTAPVLFSGDTLFRRSIGRTDFRGGDVNAIVSSIRGRLYSLPPETRVICGHGPDTTIGEERRENPFVKA
jgi:glyoxylase-like metal-dependent hydrolase (beta-lactamase superfamily II)